MNCHINCYCLSRKAFHALWVVKDCMPLSPFLTKMTPSRVQVSEILRSRFRVRASQAIVARVFVRSSFMKTWVPFNFRADRITDVLVLWVVKRTMMSRGVAPQALPIASPSSLQIESRRRSFSSCSQPAHHIHLTFFLSLIAAISVSTWNQRACEKTCASPTLLVARVVSSAVIFPETNTSKWNDFAMSLTHTEQIGLKVHPIKCYYRKSARPQKGCTPRSINIHGSVG